jgi:hypothetical protein
VPPWRQTLGAICAGILGFALALGAWTLITDHFLLHALAAIESQRQAAARPMLPAPEKK